MEESRAYRVELEYLKSQQNTSQIAYPLVHKKKGDAMLKMF